MSEEDLSYSCGLTKKRSMYQFVKLLRLLTKVSDDLKDAIWYIFMASSPLKLPTGQYVAAGIIQPNNYTKYKVPDAN